MLNIAYSQLNPIPMPRTRVCESSSYRHQFQPGWLKSFPWLHYTQYMDGAFCCVLFAPLKMGGQNVGSFITEPFTSWIKMSEKANVHSRQDHHKMSMTRMEKFLARYKNPLQSVSIILDKEAQKIVSNNQKVVESLLKIVMLYGKQGLALRGHRDNQISWGESEEEICSNQGKLVEFVRFHAEHDHILAEHLASFPRNAQYTSKTITNELVQVIGMAIHNDILQEVQRVKYYTVIADEVNDVSNKEQLSLSIRYFSSGTVKEMFLDFIEVERITGKVLGEAILHWLEVNRLSAVDL